MALSSSGDKGRRNSASLGNVDIVFNPPSQNLIPMTGQTDNEVLSPSAKRLNSEPVSLDEGKSPPRQRAKSLGRSMIDKITNKDRDRDRPHSTSHERTRDRHASTTLGDAETMSTASVLSHRNTSGGTDKEEKRTSSTFNKIRDKLHVHTSTTNRDLSAPPKLPDPNSVYTPPVRISHTTDMPNDTTDDTAYFVWMRIIKAKNLPIWPEKVDAKSYVRCSSGCDDTVTDKLREVGDAGSIIPGSYHWDESLLVTSSPKSKFITIKVNTLVKSVMLKTFNLSLNPKTGKGKSKHVTDIAVCKGRVPMEVIPIVQNVPDDDDDACANTQPILFNENARGQIESMAAEVAAQRDSPEDSRPLKLWIKMQPSERSKMVLDMASVTSGKSRGWVLVCIARIPAANIDFGFYEGDVGDPPGTEPIELAPSLSNVYVDCIIPCSVTQLNKFLFDDGSKLYQEYYKARGNTNVWATAWEPIASSDAQPLSDSTATNLDTSFRANTSIYSVGNGLPAMGDPEPYIAREETLSQRTVTYVVPANSLVSATEATETQTLCVEPGGATMNATVSTPDVPYGSCFVVKTQYATTRVSATSCRLVVSGQMDWTKKTMMKSAIESGATKSIKEAQTQLLELLMRFATPGTTSKKNSSAGEAPEGLLNQNWAWLSRKVKKGKAYLQREKLPLTVVLLLLLLLGLSLMVNVVMVRQMLLKDYEFDKLLLDTLVKN